MTRHYKLTAAFLALFLSAFFSASAATSAPRVVFIGDQITYGWTSAFAANANWINQGVPVVGYPSAGDSGSTLQRFQADVIDLHPAIVHIMIGSADADEAHDANLEILRSTIPDRTRLDGEGSKGREHSGGTWTGVGELQLR
jgi:hypothetical protein